MPNVSALGSKNTSQLTSLEINYSLKKTHIVMETILNYGSSKRTVAFDAIQLAYVQLNVIDYVELLEIRNPPPEKNPFIIINYTMGDYTFCETTFRTIAEEALESRGGNAELIKKWQKLTLTKIYSIVKSTITKPWCYGTEDYPSGYFGKEKQFTTDEPLKVTSIDEYFVISPPQPLRIEKKFGETKSAIIWESGTSSPIEGLVAINSLESAWKSSTAFSGWLSFITNKNKRDIILQFPSCSYEIKLRLWKTEEKLVLSINAKKFNGEYQSKDVVTHQKNKGELPRYLYTGNNSMFEILKFFMTT